MSSSTITDTDVLQSAKKPQNIQPAATTTASQPGCSPQFDSGSSPVYAIGSLQPFFSTLDLQAEYQAAASQLGVGQQDYYQVFSYVLSAPNTLSTQPYRYIAEQVCWVLSINNIDTYFAVPQTPLELDAFINALKNQTTASLPDHSILLGTQGPPTAAEFCANLQLPIVICRQLYGPAVSIEKALQKFSLKANNGITAADRAVNFLIINYAGISKPQPALNAANSAPLAAIDTRLSDARPGRTIIEVILTYQDSSSGLQSYYSCGIDVSDPYPFVDFPLGTYIPVNA